jgi:hypothetical protein
MVRIFLSTIAFGLLVVLTGFVLGAIAPWLILPVALLLGLLLVAIGVYQTAGPRSRNYRQIKPTDMSIGALGGSWRFPFFSEQRLPPVAPARRRGGKTPPASRRRARSARRSDTPSQQRP